MKIYNIIIPSPVPVFLFEESTGLKIVLFNDFLCDGFIIKLFEMKAWNLWEGERPGIWADGTYKVFYMVIFSAE